MSALKSYEQPRQHGDDVQRAIERILVVDDSRAQRKFLSAILRRQGYAVAQAACGKEALDIVRSDPPDLILSDWMMPGMNGLELCREVRGLASDRYVYFVLLTAKSEKGAVAEGLNIGADDFLAKPVRSDELRARISAGDRILTMERELGRKNEQISNALREISSLYEAVDRDLVEARKMQQGLVRERFRGFATADISLLLKPSGHVGGDLVGFFRAGQDKVAIYSIDVSGHGIASALLTARLASFLSDGSPEQNIALKMNSEGRMSGRPPREVAALLNKLMLEEMRSELYFTIAFGYLDLRSGRIELTQCGHPNPAVMRNSERILFRGENGMPIGLLEDAEYTEYAIQMRPGDRILLYSDGFTECAGNKGDLLGEGGFRKILAQNRELEGNDFLEALVWDLDLFCATADFPDDLSCVMVEFHGPKKSDQAKT